MDVKEKLKAVAQTLSDKGIPVILLQDPITKLPSVTFSFFLVSGIVALLATFEGFKTLSKIDYSEAKDFFDVCMIAYLGRSAIKATLGQPGADNNNSQGEKDNNA